MLFLWGLSPTVSPASCYAGVLNLGCARLLPEAQVHFTSQNDSVVCMKENTQSEEGSQSHYRNSVIKRVNQLDIRISFWYANMYFLLIHDVAQ